jgi:hypothetical protein
MLDVIAAKVDCSSAIVTSGCRPRTRRMHVGPRGASVSATIGPPSAEAAWERLMKPQGLAGLGPLPLPSSTWTGPRTPVGERPTWTCGFPVPEVTGSLWLLAVRLAPGRAAPWRAVPVLATLPDGAAADAVWPCPATAVCGLEDPPQAPTSRADADSPMAAVIQ